MAAKNRSVRKPKKDKLSEPKRTPREERPGSIGSVNLEVDRPWEMVENDALTERVRGLRYGVRVLAKGERVPVNEFLEALLGGGNEFGALMAQVEGLCRAERKDHERFFSRGRGDGRGIFELKRKRNNFRLFYFYGEDFGLGKCLIICTHGFSKSKGSRQQQDREFGRAARIRDEFLIGRGQQ